MTVNNINIQSIKEKNWMIMDTDEPGYIGPMYESKNKISES